MFHVKHRTVAFTRAHLNDMTQDITQESPSCGTDVMIGTDEAGRGPLAGPVVAAAVYLTLEQEARLHELGLRDSKKMTPHARERIFETMCEMGVSWRAQAGSVERIDRMNIFQASLWAMGCSVERLVHDLFNSRSFLPSSHAPHTMDVSITDRTVVTVIVDGPWRIPSEYMSRDLTRILTQKPVIKADTKFPVVSAASVVAKVLRDRVMVALDRLYPEYGFARHKGYPTLVHREVVARLGLSPVHRHSFCRKYECDERQLKF